MSSIDRVDWHSGNNFPHGIPEENGGTHIGMYLNWIIDSDLIGECHSKESGEGISKVKSKVISGREFLFDYCDGKFWNEDLNSIGIRFTEDYYSTDKYFDDYANTLANNLETVYHVENNWDNYAQIRKVLDHRFKKWKDKQNKRPWEFWK